MEECCFAETVVDIQVCTCSTGGDKPPVGRMYPPEDDNARAVDGRSDVIRYRHRAHNTFIRDNVAIEIQDIDGKVLFEKRGLDGRSVDLP